MKGHVHLSYFTDWLESNSNRFNHCPELVTKPNGSVFFKYKDIVPFIQPCFNSGEITVYVNYPDNETYFDALLDLDFDLGKNKSGKYYCKICHSEKKKRLFDSIEELLVNHQFEDFLKWSNANITESNYIGLFRPVPGVTCTRILPHNELNKWFSKNGDGLIALISLKEYNECEL